MSLQLHMGDLSGALEVLTDLRDGLWAYGRCRDSSLIHEDVWEELPPKEHVRDVVIPLLEQARDAVRIVPANRGRYADLVSIFAGNIEWRIQDLWNYVRGKNAEIPPGSVLVDPVASSRPISANGARSPSDA